MNEKLSDQIAHASILIYNFIEDDEEEQFLLNQLWNKYGSEGARIIAIDLAKIAVRIWNGFTQEEQKEASPFDNLFIQVFGRQIKWSDVAENGTENIDSDAILIEKIKDFIAEYNNL